MAAQLTQIIYHDSQRASCFEFADIYFNTALTIYFENEVICDVVMASTAEKIAVCSWKLKEKMKYFIGTPRPITQELLESSYDILSFTKNTKNHQMLAAAEAWHKGFKETLQKILYEIGFECPREVRMPIYQNHFSASRQTYQDYVTQYLIPAMYVMENDPEIHKMVMADSNYSKLAGATAEQTQDLQNKLGIPYYPLAPFLLERLFSVYVHNNHLNVTHL
jgi:hypothetical protein